MTLDIVGYPVGSAQIQQCPDSSITVPDYRSCDEYNFHPLRLLRRQAQSYACRMENFRLFHRSELAVDAADGLECLLRERKPLRLAAARGCRIRCMAGCAWITAPGMVEDVFLRGGEAWQIDTDGLVLVEAIGSAAVTIGAPMQAT
jgi:hypothetical protein